MFAEPKARRRARASSRGGVWRKSKAKSRGDEQKPDTRRDASGASGHVTAKPSLCGWGAFCKSGVYARIASCLTTGDLSGALEARLGVGRPTLNTVEKSANGIVGMRQVRLVRHSKPKGGATDRPSRNAEDRRPERFPERGLKERSSCWLRNDGRASGESMGRRLRGWDEADVGAARGDAPVGVRRFALSHVDSICRTAGYVTRLSGGVGGGSREASPYPKYATYFSLV